MKINNIIFDKDIDDISKKDLKVYSDIGLNTYKVFKIYSNIIALSKPIILKK